MLKKYKYEIAFSVAEEDLHIAQTIAAFLRANNISYYLYSEHQGSHWGENLMMVSMDKYAKESKCVLLILSNTYITKHWSDVERQMAQAAGKGEHGNILPLRLDDVCIDGLSKNIVYIKWNNDPGEIAKSVGVKVKGIRKKRRRNIFYWLMAALLALAFLAYSTVLVNYRTNKKVEKIEKEKEKKVDTITQKKEDLHKPVPIPFNPDMPSLHEPTSEQPVTGQDTVIKQTIVPANYYLLISGDNETWNSEVVKEIAGNLNGPNWLYTADSTSTGVRMHFTCSINTLDMELDNDTIRTTCECHLKMTDDKGTLLEDKDFWKVEFANDADTNIKSIKEYIINQLKNYLKPIDDPPGLLTKKS